MKTKCFFVTVLYCIALQANAQTGNNTVVNDNSTWSVLGVTVCPECPVWTQYIYFEGDSTINGVSYKKVFSCDDKLHENIKYEGLIREQDQKTYFIPANSEAEYLLYDFSLEDGMTFEYIDPFYQIEISFYAHVNFVEINGVQLKQIQLAKVSVPDYDTIYATWIEKIGSLTGLFYPCGVLATGVKRELLCCYQNDELTYKNPNYSECYYDNPDDITSIPTITIDDYSIFPNPVDKILNVFSSHNTISHIEIFNASGKKVYSQAFEGTINMSSFSNGLYLLKVYDKNANVSDFKIIKK